MLNKTHELLRCHPGNSQPGKPVRCLAVGSRVVDAMRFRLMYLNAFFEVGKVVTKRGCRFTNKSGNEKEKKEAVSTPPYRSYKHSAFRGCCMAL